MTATVIALRDRLIVGLDVPDAAQAAAMVARLGDTVGFYKIGMELIYGGGLPLVERLVGEGKKVFVDLKLHDIPNTVEKATAQIAKLGATFLTVHGFKPTMRAAKAGVAGSSLKLLAAREIGIDGIILSPNEVAAMRAKLGPEMVLVTPGIRPAGAALGDQKRVMTPSQALRAGADHLVVARPIVAAPDPRAAAQQILDEMAQA